MKKGFTLAEVLITLAIIGVIAAPTIPSVIVNTQQSEYKTGLKKAVSVLNSAIQANIANEGETPYHNQDLFAYLKRYMSVARVGYINTCMSASGGGLDLNREDGGQDHCGSMGGSAQFNMVFYTTDGMRFEMTSDVLDGSSKPMLLHESGIDITQYKYGRSQWGDYEYGTRTGFCGSYGLAQNPNETTNTPCIIMVDVNGDKKPNPPTAFAGQLNSSWGTNQSFVYSYASPNSKRYNDIFSIMITDEKAVPFGVVAQKAMYSK